MMMDGQKKYYRLWKNVGGERWWLLGDCDSYTGYKAKAGIFTSDDDWWVEYNDDLRKEYLSIDEHMKRWGVAGFPWLEEADS